MAFDPLFKMSFQNEAGGFLTADLNTDATWTINAPLPTLTYFEVLPDGWDVTAITYERDNDYLGIFRSMSSNGAYKFSMDAKAIIDDIYKRECLKGYCLFKIWVLNTDSSITYDLFYESYLDFKTYKDLEQTELTEIYTLDSGLVRDLHSYGDTPFNIPIWQNTGTDADPVWVTDAQWVLHDGIKLRYQTNYISSANPDNPLSYSVVDGNQLNGWNGGARGDGYHIIPALNQYSITQNNGATTFIGNTILQPFLIQGNQTPGAANFGSESSFSGVNHSQPSTKSNYSLKNLLPNTPAGGLSMSACMNFDMFDPIHGEQPVALAGGTDTGRYMAFVLFEINNDDNPDVVSSRYVHPQEIYRINLPDSTALPFFPTVFPSPDSPSGFAKKTTPLVNLTINYNKCYVFGIICDADHGFGISGYCSFGLSELKVYMESNFDNGVSGVPIAAPSLNPSVFPAFTLKQLLQKIVPNLATTRTDGYGFPIPVVTDYEGDSDFLDIANTTAVGDVVPSQIKWTSAYCIHDLQGQSYITLSFNQLFNFCKKTLGCGATLQDDKLRIENFAYFFDNTKMILDLGYDVYDLEITPITEGLGANLKLGYTQADINSNFGVDIVNTEAYFNTPLSNIPGTMDYEETDVLTEQNAIELLRAQKVSQPIGATYSPSNPSSDNQNVVLYCLPSPTVTMGVTPYLFRPFDPSNKAVWATAYQLTQRNGTNLPAAQSTDPTAATQPYIFGLYYPDSAINVELTGGRNLQRFGGLLHSQLDQMEADYLTFRNTYVMQYNNTVIGLSGMESNLQVGAGANVVTEFKDVAINTLPAKLFKGSAIRVKSRYPFSMYKTLNTDPNGYVRFFWKKPGFAVKEYHFFIKRAVQQAGNSIATEFEGWLTPDMVL